MSYRGEDIDAYTTHYRLCGADLTLIQPLVAHIQHLTQRVALPSAARAAERYDWKQIYYYGGLIAAGYVIGALIRGFIRFWFVGRGRVRPQRRTGILYRMLRIYFLIDHLQPALNWLRNVKP